MGEGCKNALVPYRWTICCGFAGGVTRRWSYRPSGTGRRFVLRGYISLLWWPVCAGSVGSLMAGQSDTSGWPDVFTGLADYCLGCWMIVRCCPPASTSPG